MWAAKIAALRGHDVILYEKGAELGGQVLLAMKGAGRDEFGVIVRNERQQLQRLEVPVILETDVTVDLVRAQQPDAVVLATGSRPKACPVAGCDGPAVFNVWQVLSGEADLGERVLVIDNDGHHQGTATAEHLADLGKVVHIVTSEPVRRLRARPDAGPLPDPAAAPHQRRDLHARLRRHGGQGHGGHGLQRVLERVGHHRRLRQRRDGHGERRERRALLRAEGAGQRSSTGSATAWRLAAWTWPSTRATWSGSGCERAARGSEVDAEAVAAETGVLAVLEPPGDDGEDHGPPLLARAARLAGALRVACGGSPGRRLRRGRRAPGRGHRRRGARSRPAGRAVCRQRPRPPAGADARPRHGDQRGARLQRRHRARRRRALRQARVRRVAREARSRTRPAACTSPRCWPMAAPSGVADGADAPRPRRARPRRAGAGRGRSSP